MAAQYQAFALADVELTTTGFAIRRHGMVEQQLKPIHGGCVQRSIVCVLVATRGCCAIWQKDAVELRLGLLHLPALSCQGLSRDHIQKWAEGAALGTA
jgi:hypothetical protein